MTRATILYSFVAGLALAATCSAGARYTIEDIGPVSGVSAINNHGEVLANDPNFQQFLYRDGTIQPLPQPSSGQFVATALNNRGEVVGYVNPPGMYVYYLAIYCDGKLRVLTDVAGVDPSAVNDRGQITGALLANHGAFLYSDGTLTPFGPSSDTGSETVPRGMNNKGEVVGFTYPGGSTNFGFLYRDGQFSTFSGPGATYTEAAAINGRGEVAGVWTSQTRLLFQVFTYRRGRFHDLGHAFGQFEEQDGVGGINRYGVIVGNGRTTTIPFGGFAAWAYYPKEGFVDLNTLIAPYSGWFLQFANGINNRGQIAGMGLLNGAQHGYILTPVDDPDENKSDQSETSE